MKVICIDSGDFDFLTIGKSYEVVQTIEYSIPAIYQVINDSDQLAWYSDYWLKSVEKIREQKLNELGI